MAVTILMAVTIQIGFSTFITNEIPPKMKMFHSIDPCDCDCRRKSLTLLELANALASAGT